MSLLRPLLSTGLQLRLRFRDGARKKRLNRRTIVLHLTDLIRRIIVESRRVDFAIALNLLLVWLLTIPSLRIEGIRRRHNQVEAFAHLYLIIESRDAYLVFQLAIRVLPQVTIQRIEPLPLIDHVFIRGIVIHELVLVEHLGIRVPPVDLKNLVVLK